MIKKYIIILLKGIIIGGTMLVPGVSGGSMAMILGIYDRLISAVSSFSTHKKDNFILLSVFSSGAVSGMLILASPILKLIELYRFPAMFFFIGAVAGGIPMIYKQSEMKNISWKTFAYLAAGIFAVLAISFIPSDIFSGNPGSAVYRTALLLVSGIISAAALILPGISVSYMLLIMGMYDEVIEAISGIHLPYLIPLGAGLLGGIFLTAKLLEKAMKKHPQPTYLIIMGFIVGSVIKVFPGLPSGIQVPISLVTFLVGFTAIFALSKSELKKT